MGALLLANTAVKELNRNPKTTIFILVALRTWNVSRLNMLLVDETSEGPSYNWYRQEHGITRVSRFKPEIRNARVT
jgi:hypothetical protein